MAQFTNKATLTYGNVSKESNETVGEIISAVTLYKKAVYDVYERGDRIAYIVGISNESQTGYTSVTLSDNLGLFNAGTEASPVNVTPLTFISGSLSYWINGIPSTQIPTASVSNNTLTISNIAVPANSFVQIGYEVRVNDYAPLGLESEITNTVSLTGAGSSQSITAEETIYAGNELNVEITKALAPLRVNENGRVTYSFTLSNYSVRAAQAEDSLVITDTFSPYINITEVTFNNGTTEEAWNLTSDYTYTANGVFTSVAGGITVPAATATTDSTTGIVTLTPGTSVLTITGTLA